LGVFTEHEILQLQLRKSTIQYIHTQNLLRQDTAKNQKEIVAIQATMEELFYMFWRGVNHSSFSWHKMIN
jgi:hypothetical protein